MSNEDFIETKDYWTIIALHCAGHVSAEIAPVDGREGRGIVLVYKYPKETVEADYDAWMRGAIGPVPKEGEEQSNIYEIVRMVQQGSVQFKNNLHRFCR